MQTSATIDESLRESVLGLTLQSSPFQRERRLSSPRASPRSGSPLNDQIEVDPALIAPRPTISSLQRDFISIHAPDASPEKQVAWIQDVLFLVYRTYLPPPDVVSVDPELKRLDIDDPALQQLAKSAVELLLTLVPSVPPAGTKLAPPIAEALQIRASLSQTGIFPAYIKQDPRKAFRTFEASARAEHHAAWFNLGRCYEVFKDARRAKDCYERGVIKDDTKCLYRMGLAHLMGHLGIEVSPTIALSLLFRAAKKATVAVPQPAYVFGCLLRGDFAHTSAVLPASLFEPYIPAGSSIEQEALKYIVQAAYLHYTPAQYKLGYYYESDEAYDPLLSVQYYTLASEVEPEAFFALSKWFVCGAKDLFEKDELLARTCAERAARAGVVNAEFAVGYYWEVGIGSEKNLRQAKKWYEKAAAHGNAEAIKKLAALKQNTSLSRQDHEKLAEETLIRRRTQAKQRFEASGSVRRTQKGDPEKVVELARKASKAQPRGERLRRPDKKIVALDAIADVGIDATEETKVDSVYSNAYAAVDSVVERAPGNSDEFKYVEDSTGRRSRESTLAPPIQYPERKRYSLVDPGPTSRSPSPLSRPHQQYLSDGDSRSDGTKTPPRRHGSPSPRTYRTGSEARSSVPSAASSDRDRPISSSGLDTPGNSSEDSRERRARYSTFEEMGIKASKVEEKDCVIM